MADTTYSALSNVLKNVYLGPIREMINQASVTFAKIGREKVETGGDQTIVPLHTGRNASAGVGRVENADLPVPDRQKYKKAIMTVKRQYGQIRLTGFAMKATRSDKFAFIRAVESEVKGAVRDTKRAFNRQVLGDGRDVLATLRGAIGGATAAQLNDGLLAAGKGNAFVHVGSGDTVDIYAAAATSASSPLYSNVTVTITGEGSAAGETYKTATLGTTVTTSAGDILVPPGTWGEQLMGLRGIISNTDPVLCGGLTGLHGLPVASNPEWAAIVHGNGGTKRTLSLALMQKPLSEIAISSDFSDKDVEFMLGNVYFRDTYIGLLTGLKRFVNTMELDGGWEGVEFNGKPFIVDTQAARNELLYVVPESLKFFVWSDIDWMDEDGAILVREMSGNGKDAYRATLFAYLDLCTVARNANAVLKDITEA